MRCERKIRCRGVSRLCFLFKPHAWANLSSTKGYADTEQSASLLRPEKEIHLSWRLPPEKAGRRAGRVSPSKAAFLARVC